MGKDVIVACDFSSAEQTFAFLDKFTGRKPFVKIGMELYYAEGPEIVRQIKARGHKIFLDLKLHDIPNTVKKAMAVLRNLDVDITNLHAAGTTAMMQAALEGLTRPDGTRPLLIAVTQLTSTDQEAMERDLMIHEPMDRVVMHYAETAKNAGLDGVVCSPLEAEKVHSTCGKNFITVTPGVRFADGDAGDQKRVMTPAGIHEYALSETQKFGHVTYFWNGNRSGKVDENLEVYEEVPSDVIPFEQAPAMKSKEITEKMVENMASHKFQFLRCNFPNGDMVGHTGVYDAVVYAMECVDKSVKAIIDAADKYGYTVLITADHGNADQMTETKKGKTSVRTAHSLNPVPFIIYDKDHEWHIKDGHFGLANVAPTVVKMMGLTAPDCWEESMV